MKNVVILGSTGSIGKSAIRFIERHKNVFRVTGLAANTNIEDLSAQARSLGVRKIAVAGHCGLTALKKLLPAKAMVFSGRDGVLDLIRSTGSDTVLMAIGGTASILPAIEAAKMGRRLALASKEALVSAGTLLNEALKKSGGEIIPVDSEHSAVYQCLKSGARKDLKRIILTGSGGPLKDVMGKDFKALSVDRVLAHPKWKMGRKITVDSATMMNKGLEMIEAKYLFGIDMPGIDVVIHPEAIVHSMVEFEDSTVMANMSVPDMRIPIAYALGYPARIATGVTRLDLAGIGRLTFEKPDCKKFPALSICRKAGECQSASCALNAANEEAVHGFLEGRIRFTDIIHIIESVLSSCRVIKDPTLDDILDMDKWAKIKARELIRKLERKAK